MLEDFKHEFQLFKPSKSIREIFEYRLKWIDDKIQADSEFSWQMKKAVFPQNKQVEDFLKSDARELILDGVFNSISDAREFVKNYNGLKNGFSTEMKEYGTDQSAQVKIVKTKEFFEKKKDNLQKYEKERLEIQSFFDKFYN